VSARYKIRNIRSDVLLEVRITKGRKLFKHANLVKGAVAKGVVTSDASLQVREKDLRTGKTTPWQTITKGAPARTPAKKNPKKKPVKKKAKKNPKRKPTTIQKIARHEKAAAAAEIRAAKLALLGQLRRATLQRELAKRHREKAGKLIKKVQAIRPTKKNPAKKKTKKSTAKKKGKKKAKKAARKNPCPPRRKK